MLQDIALQLHEAILMFKENFSSRQVEYQNNHIKHFWVDNYLQLIPKHLRYIREEGKTQYDLGMRFGWRRWINKSIQALKNNLFEFGGIRGGFQGVFLSFFYAWYVSMSILSLWIYQRNIKNSDITLSE